MTPEQRRLRAKVAANARWSRPMARADQADAARSAIFARLERQVDPAGNLPPDERAFLVRAAARQLSAKLNSARARRRAISTLRVLAALPMSQKPRVAEAPSGKYTHNWYLYGLPLNAGARRRVITPGAELQHDAIHPEPV